MGLGAVWYLAMMFLMIHPFEKKIAASNASKVVFLLMDGLRVSQAAIISSNIQSNGLRASPVIFEMMNI
jgi:hypothetical protein